MRPSPRLRRPLLALLSAALLLLLPGCATVPAPTKDPRPQSRIEAPAPPIGADALPRWREGFDHFLRTLAPLDTTESPLANESADSPLPDLSPEQLAPALAALESFTLGPGETLVFPPIHGPETPFPDHHPLRKIAGLRTIQARRLLSAGDWPAALALVRQNLAQARAALGAQEGLIPLIHATGVWQCALDGAHALARSPAFPAAEARALLAELQADEPLLGVALSRALRGEYFHVYRVIVERMPQTDDPDLLLSAVSSLGMAEAESLEPGELGLGISQHRLLDREATLAAYEADLAPYLAAFAASSRFPRAIYGEVTAPTLQAYRKQLGAFYDYTSEDSPSTFEFLLRARADMEATPNPVGKLLAIYLTPPWDVLIASACRREAQRSAVCGLLAWRIHGRPAPWDEIVAAGILPAPPADPFSDAALRFDLGESPRVWSVHVDGADGGGHPVEANSGQPDDLVWIY